VVVVRTHYETLGVPTDAALPVIRAAYRQLARQTHPDTGGAAEQFAAVSLAWSVLSDQPARERYDAELHLLHGGWGADVGFDEPVPAPTSAAQAGAPVPDFPPQAPLPLDPFGSPARAMPPIERELSRIRPELPQPVRQNALRWFGGAMLAALPLGVLLHVAASASTTALVGAYVFVGAGALLLALPGSRAGGSYVARFVTVLVTGIAAVAFAGISAVTGSPTPDGVGPSAATQAVLMLTWLGAGVAWFVSARRSTRRTDWVRAAQVVHDRRRVAESWNALLRARDTGGATLLERDIVLDGRWAVDSWVLRDARTGHVLATARAAAPRAWAEELGTAGVAVVIDWPTGPVRYAPDAHRV
jgi:hypothetical protein